MSILKENFINIMYKFGIDFEYDEHQTVDGVVQLKDDYMVVYNFVLYDEERLYLCIKYPELDEDEEIGMFYQQDFDYIRSYEIYYDFVKRQEDPTYQSEIKTRIMSRYIKGEK